jgi:transposase, IS6 family
MAADRAGPYSLRRPLVLAILTIAARRRRAASTSAGCKPTVWRRVQRYGPELEQCFRRYLKPTNKSWRLDETYVREQGQLFRKALCDQSHPQPRVINTDLAPLYGAAIADIKKEGILRRRCRHRPVQYLNNILEQDHRAIKRRVNAKQRFREFQAAWRTIQGYEAMNMIRKGQARWVGGTNVRRQIQFIQKLFELPA